MAKHQPTELERLGSEPLPAAEELAARFDVKDHPNPATVEEHRELMRNLGFGKKFTDYMAHMRWTSADGWHEKEVIPFGLLSLSPAAAVLHYGQSAFEGIKAYRHEDGSIWTFRPGYNAARMNHSSWRLAMPQMDREDFVGALAAYVRADARWVPSEPGASLYLRPFLFASEAFLGVRPADEVDFYVIGSPSGAYFSVSDGVSIWVESEFHRAGPGGTGSAKVGGNYAASMLPQVLAAERGFDQVCYVDTREGKHLEELGGMNMFVIMADGVVRTPELTGVILEGGTRSAIITLLEDSGVEVREEAIDLSELVEGIRSGEVAEIFACGTAAVVTPIARLAGEGFDESLPVGETTLSIYRRLTDIQLGKAEDPYGWMYKIC